MRLDKKGMAHRVVWLVVDADGRILYTCRTRYLARANILGRSRARIRKALMIYAVAKPKKARNA